MKDVAHHCGVSVATVSAVVNGADWVSPDTRERVARAVEATGYRPNRLARSLKTQQGYAVGAVVSDLTNPFFTQIVRSLSHALRERGRNLFLGDADHRFDLGDENVQMLLERQVDGLVLIGDSVRPETLGRYVRRGHSVPIVAIERDYPLDDVHCLLVDSREGAFTGTTHLIEQGYRRIGLISGPQEGPGSTTYGRAERYSGYRDALSEAGLRFDEALVVEGTFRHDSGYAAMQRLLTLSPAPEAVFAMNDLMALGAMQAAREAGLSIPDDLALVGYDDIPMAALTSPGLTTLAMPKQALGEAAADLLHAQMNSSNGRASVRRMFSTGLIVRGSSTSVS